MADENDEDALFDRLAKGLEAIRQDAELARSGGAKGISAGLARVEAELSRLATGVEALGRRGEDQQAVIVRLATAAAKTEADLQRLRQTVEAQTVAALTQGVREQPQVLAEPSARKPLLRVAALIGIGLAVLVSASMAAWIATGREPTVGALAHGFVVRLSEFSGIHPAAPDERTPSAVTVTRATPYPEPAPRPPAAPAPSAGSEPVPAAPPQPAPVAPPLPVPAAPLPAAGIAPVETPPVAPPPARTAAVIPPPAAISAPAAAQPNAQSTPPAPAAVTQSPRPPPAVRQLAVRATADAWVQVRQKDGRVLLRRIMKEGETWPVPAEPDLLLDTGNASGLELEVDGVPVRLTGAKGSVIRDVPLDAELLGSGVARPAR